MGTSRGTQPGVSTPDSNVRYIEQCFDAFIFYIGNLTYLCNALLCPSTADNRNTNQTMTKRASSEQEEAHHRQCELGNNSTRNLATALNLSQLSGVAPSPGVHQTLLKPPGSLPRNAARRQHPRRQCEVY